MKNRDAGPARIPPFPRLSGRLYIFPAFIPMVELLPWLLTAVGALAGASQLAFWQRHKYKALAVAAICFLAAGGVYLWGQAHRPSVAEGSLLVAVRDLPVLTAGVAALPHPPEKIYDDFAPLWSVDLTDEPLSTPVFDNNLLLIGTFGGALEARDAHDGHLVWRLKKHEPVFTNAAIAGGLGFIGEGLHTAPAAALTAFSVADGKPLWERQFRSHVEATATLDPAHQRLWTCAGSQGLWALDMRDGSVLWHKETGHMDATPLYAGGHIYVSAQPDEKVAGAELSSLDPGDGAVQWRVKLPGNTMGSPQLGPSGEILLTTAMGQVGPKAAGDAGWSHAVSPEGKLLWSVALPGLPLPEPVIAAKTGLVIHTLKTGEIVALHIRDGAKAWSLRLGEEFDAPAALRGETQPPLLAAITASGAVGLINAEDGTEIRRLNAGQGGYVQPAFRGDLLYITTPRRMTAYGGVHLLTKGTE